MKTKFKKSTYIIIGVLTFILLFSFFMPALLFRNT